MRLAVPLVVVSRVTQAEVRAQIDDAVGEGGQVIDPAHGAAVGQPEKQQIAFLDCLRSLELELRALSEVGMREVHELSVKALARDLLDLEMRMRQCEAEQFPPV